MPQKNSENNGNFKKLKLFSGFCLVHLEFFKIFFVSGITFLYISTTTDRKINAGFRFSKKISHFSRGYVNIESYGKNLSGPKLLQTTVLYGKYNFLGNI